MQTSTSRSRRRGSAWGLALALFCVMVFSGCNRGPAMSNVSGTVLYKDGTVPTGAVCLVSFLPTDESTAEVRKGASGVINPDGTFDMWTRMPGDGVFHGEYGVRFAVQQSTTNLTSSLLPKYTNVKTSGYTITVDGNIDDLKFEIEKATGMARGGAGGAAR